MLRVRHRWRLITTLLIEHLFKHERSLSGGSDSLHSDNTKLIDETLRLELRYLMAVSHIVLANNQITNRYIEKVYSMPVYAWSTLYAVVQFPGLLAKDIQNLFPRPQNSVSRSIALLKNREWLYDMPSKQDTRAKKLYPTEAGRTILRQIEKKVQRRQDEIFGVLSSEERDVFLGLCRKIIFDGGLASSDVLDS